MELRISNHIFGNEQQMLALISHDGQFLFVNNTFCKITGYASDELIGQHRKILASGYHTDDFFDNLWRFCNSGNIWQGEILNKRKDGSFFWMETTIIPLFDEHGVLQQSISLSNDITERKQKEEMLQLHEWIIQSTNDAVLSKDLNGIIMSCNTGAEKLFGYSKEELIGKEITLLIPPEKLSEEKMFISLIKSDKKIENYETERIKKDGTRVQISITLSPIKDKSGNIIGASKIAHDISLRKKEEKTLAESEERYRTYFQKSPLPMFVLEMPGYRILDVNMAAIAHYGYSKEEFLQLTAADLRNEKERERFLNSIPDLNNTQTLNRGIWEHIKKDGTPILVNVYASNVVFDGKPARLVMSLDVTSQKAAEEKLAQSEARYRETLDNMMEGVQIIGFDGTLLYINDTLSRQAKYTKEEMIGKKLPELYPGVEQSKIYQSYQRCLKEREPIMVDDKFIYPDNSHRYFEISIQPVPEGIFVLSVDVSEQREIDEKLRLLNEEIAKSEKRFRGIIENSHEIFLLADASMHSVYRSPSANRIVGNMDEGTEENRLKRIHPDDQQTYVIKIQEAINNPGKPVPVSFRFRHSEGHFVWLEGSLTNLLQDDAVKAMVANLQDITKRKQSEELLANSERIYRTIASKILGSVICIVDTELRYTLVEGDMLTKLGYSKKELIGNRITDIASGDRLTTVMGFLNKALAGEEVKIEDTINGIETLSSYIPLKNTNGDVHSVMVMVIDVSELKATQQALENLNHSLENTITERTAQLVTANQELEAFSYSVSHDLRAPLRGIDGWSLALLEDYGNQLDEKASGYLNRVRSETQRMGELIDDMLKLSRITRTEVKPTHVNLSSLANEVVNRLKEANPSREIVFTIQPGLIAECDANLLEIVLTNLLSNAVKFTAKKMPAEISLSAEIKNHKIVYCIKDNGAGFDMSTAKKLFGAFQRMHRQSEFPGTGIGLAIVKRIISLHQGEIWAEAIKDNGASFYFTLKSES